MISKEVQKKYRPTIGIECHVQLKTKTKLFAAVDNDARGAGPNTLISHICMGLPGALPVLNEQAVRLAIRAALAFQTEPAKISVFERKHYFYPDLPMGYQISQLKQPVIVGGKVDIVIGDKQKTVKLTRAQLEADAGKSTHHAGDDFSLVDLNRAGTPLLEIVSEPDIHSAEEAKAYAKELYLLARYADISDADLYHGNMRFDVNVSVSKDDTLGTRTETKNLNSFKSVERAVAYEIDRQIELLEKGGDIVQETRGWDDAKQKTFSQRSKEEAHDYRYFPDPDIPPVEINDKDVETVRQTMPVLPFEWRRRLAKAGLDTHQSQTLLDAEVEDEAVSYLHLLEAHLGNGEFIASLANWFVNVEIPLRRKSSGSLPEITNEQRLEFYDGLFKMNNSGKLSSTGAKALITAILESGARPKDLEKYAAEQGLTQVSDEGEIAKIVREVIDQNPKVTQDIKDGETKAIGFLIGQVMKNSQGKANPGLARQEIQKQLGL